MCYCLQYGIGDFGCENKTHIVHIIIRYVTQNGRALQTLVNARNDSQFKMYRKCILYNVEPWLPA